MRVRVQACGETHEIVDVLWRDSETKWPPYSHGVVVTTAIGISGQGETFDTAIINLVRKLERLESENED
jgi:hypothetical protein